MDDQHFVEHLLEEIDFAMDQKRWDTVEELATKILSIDPDNPDAFALSRAAQRRLKVQPPTRPGEVDVTEQTYPKEPSPDSFIGRDEELIHLRQTPDRVVGEHGQMDMLVGEPGVGKSRLSEELSAYARETGVRVLYGRCYEEGGTPPYWPWTQAIRAYLAETQSDELSAVLGRRAPLVAAIFPEIKRTGSRPGGFRSGDTRTGDRSFQAFRCGGVIFRWYFRHFTDTDRTRRSPLG